MRIRPSAASFTHELCKLAKKKDDEGPSSQQLAVGAAGASPFAGLIGQERIRHDPHTNPNVRRFKSIEDLQRHARPGDVIITSKPKSTWKTMQIPMGATEFYHAQPVVGRRKGRGLTASAGNYRDPYYQRLGKKDFLSELENIKNEMRSEKYKDVVLLRPKEKMSKAQLDKFVEQGLARSRTEYDTAQGIKGWMRELFVPKIIPRKALEKVEGPTTIRYQRIVDPETGKRVKRPLYCKGNVCSTVASQSYTAATGRGVVRSKGARNVMPADFMRSKNFDAVGSVVKHTKKVPLWKPMAARGAMGLGLAGTAYAATEKPEVAAGLAGTAAGSYAWNKMIERKGLEQGLSKKQIVAKQHSFMRAMDEALNAENPKLGRKELYKYIRKAGLAKLLGGVGAYALTRALINRKKDPQKSTRPPASSGESSPPTGVPPS